jgi:FtsP/CotA-like multicopper oxidase with cupredoxin domain
MSPYAWAIDGGMWPDYRPLHVRTGERVEVEMVNLTGMAHPMHLHGHVFQVIALQGKPVTGAMRDTVMVPANGSVTVAFDADNPGRWLFHCHNLYHMATGMMSALVYDDYA